jgi:hypothetical protein
MRIAFRSISQAKRLRQSESGWGAVWARGIKRAQSYGFAPFCEERMFLGFLWFMYALLCASCNKTCHLM